MEMAWKYGFSTLLASCFQYRISLKVPVKFLCFHFQLLGLNKSNHWRRNVNFLLLTQLINFSNVIMALYKVRNLFQNTLFIMRVFDLFASELSMYHVLLLVNEKYLMQQAYLSVRNISVFESDYTVLCSRPKYMSKA